MPREKIPCSVGILTLNSEATLEACLESLQDFAEIIICDGNSTDRTIEIAHRHKAKIIKQYDSTEPNLPCVEDKATVRQRNMDAASYDWYLFVDADDTLSPEAVEEIRLIVTHTRREHLIYRIPTRIYLHQNGTKKEITHEALLPSHQTRLVNRTINPHFEGRVHEQLIYDVSQYSIGTMVHFYNIHWSTQRLEHFWSYLKQYAVWEIETTEYASSSAFLYQGIYQRMKLVLAKLFYYLPGLYLKYGSEDSMPLPIELTLIRYHAYIIFKTIQKYISEITLIQIIREIIQGTPMNRVLAYLPIRTKEYNGLIMDIGGKKSAGFYRYIDILKWHKIIFVDRKSDTHPDFVVDLETDDVPMARGTLDAVFAFDILHHFYNREKVMRHMFALLKSGGEIAGSIPFLVGAHPDPYDFARLTRQGLKGLLQEIGFRDITIIAIGTGPFLAGYNHIEYILPRVLRFFVLPCVYICDRVVNGLARGTLLKEKFPLAYVFFAKK